MLFFSIFLWLLRTFKYWQRFDLATAQPRLVCCFTTQLILVRVLACSVMLVMPCKHPLYRIQKRIIAVSFASFVAVRGCAVGAQTKIPTVFRREERRYSTTTKYASTSSSPIVSLANAGSWLNASWCLEGDAALLRWYAAGGTGIQRRRKPTETKSQSRAVETTFPAEGQMKNRLRRRTRRSTSLRRAEEFNESKSFYCSPHHRASTPGENEIPPIGWI